jgi:hypothetical protein
MNCKIGEKDVSKGKKCELSCPKTHGSFMMKLTGKFYVTLQGSV